MINGDKAVQLIIYGKERDRVGLSQVEKGGIRKPLGKSCGERWSFAVSHFPEHKKVGGFLKLQIKFNIVTALPLTGLTRS